MLFKLPVSALAMMLLSASMANAQCPAVNSTPGFTAGGTVFGRNAAQWNAYAGAKVDVNNGVLCNPTIYPPISIYSQSQFTFTPAAAPDAPLAGWTIYVDSGDGNKLKAIYSTGTIVTLGTP